MCLSIPAKVLSIEGDLAKVSIGDNKFSVGLQLIEYVAIGDYVLIHSGFIIQKISKEDADIATELYNQLI